MCANRNTFATAKATESGTWPQYKLKTVQHLKDHEKFLVRRVSIGLHADHVSVSRSGTNALPQVHSSTGNMSVPTAEGCGRLQSQSNPSPAVFGSANLQPASVRQTTGPAPRGPKRQGTGIH